MATGPPSDESDPLTIPSTVPSKPSAFNASGGNASVTLTWTAGSDGGGTLTEWQYSQKAGEGDFGGWNRICRTSDDSECPDTTSHTVASLTNGTAYKFKVRAVNLIGNGAASDESASVTPSTTPAKPTNLTVSAGDETVSLSWTAGGNGGSAITGWKYQQKEGSNNWGGWTAVPDSGASTTSYTVTGLTNGTTYKFKVRAVNTNGDGTPSDESASATPKAATVTLTASEITSTSATLTLANYAGDWSYKGTPANSPCNAVADGTTTAELSDLTPGTEYNYVAFNSSTCGPTTAEIARETFTTPVAATLTASAVEATTATLTIGNHTGNWHYKRTAPTMGSCSSAVSGTSEDLTGLTAGTSHTFKAYSDSNCSKELASEPLLTKPGKTTGVSPDPGSTEIGVSWTAVTGGASYKVQWKSDNEDYDTNRQATPTSASHRITGLTNDTEYTVRVAAVNATGDGAWSDEVKATPQAIRLTATNIAQTTATLQIAGYTKAWSFQRTGNLDCTAVAANTSTKNVAGLTANTEYTYHAYGAAQCITSLKITEHTFTTLSAVTLTASAIEATTAKLTIANHSGAWWHKKTAPSPAGSCTPVGTGTATVDVSGLTPGASHTFKAYGDNNCSTLLASASPFLTKPGKTAGLKVSYRGGELKPSWTAVTGATGYKVQWATDGSPPNWNSGQQATVSGSAHDIQNLTNGTAYAVRVAATNGTGDGAWSDKATATPQKINLTVDADTITDTKASLTLSGWTGPWWHISDESGAQCASVPANTAKADIAGLTPSTNYQVFAYESQGCGPTSAQIASVIFRTADATQETVTVPPVVSEPAITVPDAPSEPVASTGNRLATLTWTAGGDGGSTVTGWEYRQRQPGGDWGAWTGVCAAGDADCASRSSHTVTSLVNGATYTFQVRAVNAVGPGQASAESNEATPAAPPPSFGDSTIADQAYKQNAAIKPYVLPAGSGDGGLLSYTLTPALPPGLAFDTATRTLGGTPTEPSAARIYTYTVTDSEAIYPGSASLTFTISVAADLAPRFAMDASVADRTYVQNTPINPLTLPAASGGDGALVYTLTPALPPGLTFDAATRTVGGTPSEAADAATYTWMATDSDVADADSASLTFTVTVEADLAPDFGGASVVDLNYQQTIPVDALTLPAATGGDGALTYALTPALPAGLTFDPVARALSGTPAAPSAARTYTYTATDADATGPDSASLTFSLAVAADTAPDFGGERIEDLRLIRGQIMEPLVLPVAGGGNGALSYSLSGELPAGLSFDPATRVLSGLPTELAENRSFEYTVVDSDRLEPDAAALTFAIEVTYSAADKAILNDVLAAQGRALLTNAAGAIGERFRTPATAPAAAATVNEDDQDRATATLNTLAHWLANRARGAPPAGRAYPGTGGLAGGLTPTAGDADRTHDWNMGLLLQGRSFEIPLFAANDGAESSDGGGSGGTDGGGNGGTGYALPSRWTLWGAATAQNFDGASVAGQFQGGVTSMFLGADARIGGDWLAGAALSRNRGKSDYTVDGREGRLGTELTGIHPYIRGEFGAGLEVWALGGVGNGEATDMDEGIGALGETADLEMTMAAAGLRQPLSQTRRGGVLAGGRRRHGVATHGGRRGSPSRGRPGRRRYAGPARIRDLPRERGGVAVPAAGRTGRWRRRAHRGGR